MKKILPIMVIGILILGGFGAIVSTGDNIIDLKEERELCVFSDDSVKANMIKTPSNPGVENPLL